MKEKLQTLLTICKAKFYLFVKRAQGEFPRGERIRKHRERIVQVVDKPSWNEWCKEFKVGSKVNRNKPIYYEMNNQIK